jgi:hypothetical protein
MKAPTRNPGRDQEIARRLAAGETARNLASEYGLTKARVYQVAKLYPQAATASGAESPFRGQTQVLHGTASRRPLTLSPAMRYAAERARADQPPIKGLHSSVPEGGRP